MSRLPGQWADTAACRDMDVNTFYPNRQADDYDQQLRAARAVCGRCPVALDCMRWAIETGEEWGVFGGATARERRAVVQLIRERRTRSAVVVQQPDLGVAA